jgi:hypothetical protein
MKFSLLTPALAVLLTGAFVTGACTVGTLSDDDAFGGGGGEAGSGSGGQSNSGGTGTGGPGGQGGSGDVVDCEADGTALGTPGSTDPATTDDDCAKCQMVNCSESYSLCNAHNPKAACRYGTTEFDSMTIDGEWDCMNSCFFKRQETGDWAGDQEDVDACAALCKSAECDAISPVTTDLASCTLLGPNHDGVDNCYDICFAP